jgi:predicted N-acetyltransferase YhbS
LNLPESYCLAATRDGLLIGYLLAYGWPGQAPSLIGTVLTKDETSEVLFIHDLASLTEAQGSGIGRTLVMRAFELAALDGLFEAQLIAVEGAASYWQRLGFAEVGTTEKLAAAVAQYGGEARWMTREIGSSAPADNAGRRIS